MSEAIIEKLKIYERSSGNDIDVNDLKLKEDSVVYITNWDRIVSKDKTKCLTVHGKYNHVTNKPFKISENFDKKDNFSIIFSGNNSGNIFIVNNYSNDYLEPIGNTKFGRSHPAPRIYKWSVKYLEPPKIKTPEKELLLGSYFSGNFVKGTGLGEGKNVAVAKGKFSNPFKLQPRHEALFKVKDKKSNGSLLKYGDYYLMISDTQQIYRNSSAFVLSWTKDKSRAARFIQDDKGIKISRDNNTGNAKGYYLDFSNGNSIVNSISDTLVSPAFFHYNSGDIDFRDYPSPYLTMPLEHIMGTTLTGLIKINFNNSSHYLRCTSNNDDDICPYGGEPLELNSYHRKKIAVYFNGLYVYTNLNFTKDQDKINKKCNGGKVYFAPSGKHEFHFPYVDLSNPYYDDVKLGIKNKGYHYICHQDCRTYNFNTKLKLTKLGGIATKFTGYRQTTLNKSDEIEANSNEMTLNNKRIRNLLGNYLEVIENKYLCFNETSGDVFNIGKNFIRKKFAGKFYLYDENNNKINVSNTILGNGYKVPTINSKYIKVYDTIEEVIVKSNISKILSKGE